MRIITHIIMTNMLSKTDYLIQIHTYPFPICIYSTIYLLFLKEYFCVKKDQ